MESGLSLVNDVCEICFKYIGESMASKKIDFISIIFIWPKKEKKIKLGNLSWDLILTNILNYN